MYRVSQNRNYNSYTNMNYRNDGLIRDFGPNPLVINIEGLTNENSTFRTTLWTGTHLQVTVMSIPVGESIGVEMHQDVDQFLRIEQGTGLVQMGNTRDNLSFQRMAGNNDAIIVPAGIWHNLTNTGNVPIKLYSIYAPPNHPRDTVHKTKEDTKH